MNVDELAAMADQVGGQCSRPVALLLRLSRARVYLGARDRVCTLLLPLSLISGYIAKVVDRAATDGRMFAR